MKSETYKDRICMNKEGEIPQMTSDPQHEPSGQADAQEEEVDPLVEEDAQGDHQAHQEDCRVDHREETTTIETGTISKETMKAII